MKTQRKLLTDEQKDQICEKTNYNCHDCSLAIRIYDITCCYLTVEKIEKAIMDFWNEEIEVIE